MLGLFINNDCGGTSNNSGEYYDCIRGIGMKSTLQGILLAGILGLLLLGNSKYIYALDDFDLMKYGPEDTIEVVRTDFIIKFVLYKFPQRLNEAYESANGEALPEGGSVRGFAVVKPDEDICFVHIIIPKIWDDRESLTIIGHEIMHCALADHKPIIINDIAETEIETEIETETETETEVLGDIEDLYAQDRILELEWLKEDYEKMGIKIY